MRVFGPLGVCFLSAAAGFIGCTAPESSNDKDSSAARALQGTQKSAAETSGDVLVPTVEGSDVPSPGGFDDGGSADAGGASSIGSNSVSPSVAGPGVGETSGSQQEVTGYDAGTSTAQALVGSSVAEAVGADAGGVGSGADPDSNTAGGSELGAADAAADAAGGDGDSELGAGSSVGDAATDNPGPECRETVGRCDPSGACATQTCQFDISGKVCAFTPKRAVLFSCVIPGVTPDYAPCDLDDACLAGSVCVADTFVGRDSDNNPVPRRSGTMCRPSCDIDSDCPDGDWCQQATDDDDQPIADLRVCHRYCQDEVECYGEPVSDDIRCTPQDMILGHEASECSRKPPNLVAPTSALGLDTSVELKVETSPTSGIGDTLLLLQAVQAADAAEAGYCLSNWDCEEPDVLCVENACRLGCEDDTDCLAGSECVTLGEAQVCSEPCAINPVPGSTCSVSPANCGCGQGETCRVNEDQTNTCSPLGAQGYMAWCNNQAQCGDGLSCIAGLCRPVCVPGERECPSNQGQCLLTLKSESAETYTCSGRCDPVNPSLETDELLPCGVGAVCLPSVDKVAYPHALCVAESPGHRPRAAGETCSDDYDCVSGLGCDVASTCQLWCRDNSDCANGTCNKESGVYGVVPRFGVDAADRVGLCSE